MIEPVLSDDAFLEDIEAVRRRAGMLDIWWLGQSGFLVHYRGNWLLIDPYLSDSLTKKYAGTEKPHVRVTSRVIDPEDLAHKIFAPITVTSSHAHTDHLDPDTLRPLLATPFVDNVVVPRACEDLALQRSRSDKMRDGIAFFPMDEGERAAVGRGIDVTAIASAHDSVERDDAGHCKYLGYVFEFRLASTNRDREQFNLPTEWTIYHSGDTIFYDGLVEKLRPFNIDLAILPINGKVGNMNGADAARLAKEIGAKLVVPCHYEMFEFNTASPYDLFVPECERLGQPYKVLRAGERLTLGAT